MSDEQTDQYLIHSDVFSSIENESNDEQFSRNSIQFVIVPNENPGSIHVDDDGDFDLSRPERLHFTLVHRNETNISDCGYQLWNGALLLCDYILSNQSRFVQKTILELGAGIGLCSLIASRYASTIICTDHDPNLLEIIKENLQINADVCRSECLQIQKFDWKQSDVEEIDDQIEIILAADVIYDDDLTDVLFDVLTKLFQKKSKLHSIYLTMEKRINFYLESLSVQCPAYEYFLEKLTQFQTYLPILTMEQMKIDLQSLPQCTSIYQRTNELVLWHIFHSERYFS